ncbi:helix-turn-helix transcriptional regulator [Azospirillum brasilense]|uniref:helix-turn-helix transcriptional regulator n=1 Tax=Azospirillum brasilense TaxID=192 RepID=UPI00157B7EF2|nr:helix-turn-helix transcriptional regulator [Azospirillum brasilense]
MTDTAQKIRDLRKQLSLTQAELAERLGVAQSTVARWERGSEISQENLLPLAKLAGQTVDQFLNGDVTGAVTKTSPGPSEDAKRRFMAALDKMTPDEIASELRAIEARVAGRTPADQR